MPVQTPMKKTIKKLDNNVIKALTVACESFKTGISGFEWLTHSADYSNFPGSLMVTCVFTNEADRLSALDAGLDATMRKQIQGQLLKVGVVLKDARRHVFFDSEEQCHAQHGGDWGLRLNVKH